MLNLKNKNETFKIDMLYIVAFIIILAEFFLEAEGYYLGSAFTVIVCAFMILDKSSTKLTNITAIINIPVVFIIESYQYLESSHLYSMFFFLTILAKTISSIVLKKKYKKVL